MKTTLGAWPRGVHEIFALIMLWNPNAKQTREGAMTKERSFGEELGEPIAGNGLLHRRFFLQSGAALASAAAAVGTARAESIGAVSPPTMVKPGSGFTAYGMPSHWRDNIKRIL